MEKINLDDSLKQALVELQEYLALQLRYNKMLLAKRLGEISSYFTLFMLLLGLGGFFLFFLSFAGAGWINDFYSSKYIGQLVISGFYLLLLIFLVLLRKPLIYSPIRKLFGEIMIGEESENPEDIASFRNKTKLTLNLKKHKKDLDSKEKDLKEKFEVLGAQLTISNIIQTLAINAYTSFVTTSNIAKLAYNMVKRLASKKKTKRKNKSGKKRLKEGDD